MNTNREELQKTAKYRAMIHKDGSEALKTVSLVIGKDEDVSFLRKLKNVCRAFPTGVGLAANQIGICKRAVYICPKNVKSFFMINPEIISHSDEEIEGIEGCLSYPGIEKKIKRYKAIKVKYQKVDSDLNKILDGYVIEDFSDFTARIIQHEIDHLNGICLVGMVI